MAEHSNDSLETKRLHKKLTDELEQLGVRMASVEDLINAMDKSQHALLDARTPSESVSRGGQPHSLLGPDASRPNGAVDELTRLQAALDDRDGTIARLSQDLENQTRALELQAAEVDAGKTALADAESTLKRLEALLNQVGETVERLETYAEADMEHTRVLVDAVQATFRSWRWRLGHFMVSALERLMLKRSVLYGKEAIERQIEQLRATSHSRRSDLDGLRALLGLPLTGRGAPIPKRRFATKEEYDQICHEALAEFLSQEKPLTLNCSLTPRITVVLVLYNRAELTYACLRSIERYAGELCETIVIDNASSDETKSLLEKVTGANIVFNSENLGFLRACNQAAEMAAGEYILFLNNDALLSPNALENALAVFDSEDDVGAVGGRLILPDGTLQEAGSIVWKDGSCQGYGRGENPENFEFAYRRTVDYCSGAFLLTPTYLFNALDRFDDAFAPAYYEETDYCLRLQEAGYKVVYEPSVRIEHYEFGSSRRSSDAIDLQKRNRTRFAEKHRSLLANKFLPSRESILPARQLPASTTKVLMIDDRVPVPALGSGFPRANFVLRSLVDFGYDVTVYPLNFPDEGSWYDIYEAVPRRVEVARGLGRLGFSKFLAARENYYDIIYVSRPHNQEFVAPVLRRLKQRQKRALTLVYDAEAVFSLRDDMKSRLLTGKGLGTSKVDREIALASQSEVIVAVSDAERKLFEERLGREVFVVGHAISVKESRVPFESRGGFLFVGNLDADESPNVDSIEWFIKEVWPSIRSSLPEASLTIVGSARSKRAKEWAGNGIQLTGSVPSLAEYYDSHRVFIAPTRFAAGIPFKVHEAVANGIPAVVTTLLKAQLNWDDSCILSASPDKADAYAEACIRICREKALWESVVRNAQQRMREENDPQRVASELKRAFERET